MTRPCERCGGAPGIESDPAGLYRARCAVCGAVTARVASEEEAWECWDADQVDARLTGFAHGRFREEERR